MDKKTIEVSAAVIIIDRKVFAVQRGYGEYKDWWEFPGGKLEAGESAAEALVREIKEEHDTVIQIDSPIGTVEYDYPAFHLVMHCFLCGVKEGNLDLLEAEASAFLDRSSLYSVNWLPADRLILRDVEKLLE